MISVFQTVHDAKKAETRQKVTASEETLADTVMHDKHVSQAG